MFFQIGGELLSRTKHPNDRIDVHGEGGEVTVLRLRYEGTLQTRFGEMHAYTIVGVNDGRLRVVK
jgi:hypothetical protein